MPDIYHSRAGYVAVITDPDGNVIPGKISIEGYEPQAALISGINYGQQTNQQFQPTLDSSLYIYVFGDHMGSVEIEGVAFAKLCNGSAEGIIEVLDFYTQNRASKKSVPITVQIGSRPISGFLTALSIANTALADDPAAFMARYKMTINALPEK